MRAPPEALKMMRGRRDSRATSAAMAIFSPTTLPIEPPWNSKSRTARATSIPWIFPVPVMTASLRPVFFFASFRRSTYFFVSVKFRTSTDSISSPNSTNVPSSITARIRSRAGIRKW